MYKILCYLFTGHYWKADGATDNYIYHYCKHCGALRKEKK